MRHRSPLWSWRRCCWSWGAAVPPPPPAGGGTLGGEVADPGHDHQHPGLGAARRAAAGVHPGQRVAGQDARRGQRPGHRARPPRRSRRPARALAGREQAFVAEGTAGQRRLVMHNDFVLVGPTNDPAQDPRPGQHAGGREDRRAQALFVSRGDDSGTNAREKDLWTKAGSPRAGPGTRPPGRAWGATLRVASEKAGYTLSDRATYLAQRDTLALDVLSEGDPGLLNVYHVIEMTTKAGERVQPDGARRSPTGSAHAGTAADRQVRTGRVRAAAVHPGRGQGRGRPRHVSAGGGDGGRAAGRAARGGPAAAHRGRGHLVDHRADAAGLAHRHRVALLLGVPLGTAWPSAGSSADGCCSPGPTPGWACRRWWSGCSSPCCCGAAARSARRAAVHPDRHGHRPGRDRHPDRRRADGRGAPAGRPGLPAADARARRDPDAGAAGAARRGPVAAARGRPGRLRRGGQRGGCRADGRREHRRAKPGCSPPPRCSRPAAASSPWPSRSVSCCWPSPSRSTSSSPSPSSAKPRSSS